ncbi:GlcG/HbpS family heme-binding protein [Natrinema soli]|uniref:Heme-binding protein n=1 Tax=Natrinema soli TaxID=1930624 RepID=A0ABD5SJP0_9EURY|nr:heme-binding protein [Natrinema soli]
MTEVTLEAAKEIIAAAEKKADEVQVPMCIAVLDEGANLVGFHRMDDALLASIDIARNKAYSAISLKMDTRAIHDASQPGEPLYGIGNTNDGRIVTFGGGFPLRDGDGNVIGAVGVSGGSVDEDEEVARAGVDAFDED